MGKILPCDAQKSFCKDIPKTTMYSVCHCILNYDNDDNVNQIKIKHKKTMPRALFTLCILKKIDCKVLNMLVN